MKTYTRFNVVSQKVITGFLILILSVSYVSPASARAFQSSQVAAPLAQTFDCSTVSEIPLAECEALVALYNSTDGTNWVDNTDWLQTNMPCSWYGVDCYGSHVGTINLQANQLTGNIPPELGSLIGLGSLYLSFNQLTFGIPSELGSLPDLYSLHLAYNQLTGIIPPELGSLVNLEHLDLRDNQLNGSIPPELGNATSLSSLFLVNNQLTGEIPSSITNLVNLQSITFDCGFTSPDANVTDFLNQLVPDWEQCQPNMEVRLAGMGGPPVIVNGDMTPGMDDGTVFFSVTPGETSIRTFTVGNAGMSALALTDDPMVSITGDLAFTVAVQPGGVPSSLMPPLSSGEYSWFGIDFAPTSPGLYSATISIASNDPDDNPYIFAIQGEANVPFVDCATQTEIPETECDALVAVYNSTDGANWSDNTGWLQTDTPCSWYGITCANGTNVTDIDSFDNNLTGYIPAEIGNLSSLVGLNMRFNQLSGNIPATIGNLTLLQALYLGENQLSGSIPVEIGYLTALRTLYLRENQLSGGIPSEIGNLTLLASLDLRSNQLTGNIPVELGELNLLDHLFLGSNQLDGAIPVEIGNLTSLEYLGLGGNSLSGGIPIEICSLPSLYSLTLNDNLLSGAIPPEIGNLTSLGELDLSSNQLSGDVPVEIGN